MPLLKKTILFIMNFFCQQWLIIKDIQYVNLKILDMIFS